MMGEALKRAFAAEEARTRGRHAAGPWQRADAVDPQKHRSYLVLTLAAGLTPDVAYYNGRDAGGMREWLLTDDSRLGAVVWWAELHLPEEEAVKPSIDDML